MTRLYIDNQEAALPEDFTFELIKENVFFTKGGNFTLDISLNLDVPANARLYRHLNRFTMDSTFRNRSAKLIVDGRVLLDGTEIILEVNELSVSIQLASGNSELNFLVGADMKMSSLDLGDVPILSSTDALMSILYNYPECNYICMPVKATNGNDYIIVNNLTLHQIVKVQSGEVRLYTSENYPEEIRPLPYLNYIIENCIIALGYVLNHNSIRESIYNRLFIVHANNPKKFNDLMPDKTVTEFLTEVEELLDVIIMVRENRTVDILFRHEYYKEASTFYPKLVTEQFERKYLNRDEQPPAHTSSNIKYDFNDSTYYKEVDIDPEIRKTLREYRCADLTGIHTALSGMDKAVCMRKIFIDESTGQEFICKEENESHYKLWPVNTFQRVTGKSGEDIDIEIIPAPLDVIKVECCGSAGFHYYNGYVHLPVAPSYTGAAEEVITVEEAIQGKKPTSQQLNKILVAFAGPYLHITPPGKEGLVDSSYTFSYPFSITHYHASWVNDKYYLLDNTYATLAFYSQGHGLYEQIYSKTPEMNTEKEITIHALMDGVFPSVTDIFFIKGKRFVCKDIKLKITPDGLDPEYQATLYALV